MLSRDNKNKNNNSLDSKLLVKNVETRQRQWQQQQQQKSYSYMRRLHYFPASATQQQPQQQQQQAEQAHRRLHVPCHELLPTHIPSSVRCPPAADPFGRANPPPQQPPPLFHWLADRQVNNNSGETSSRKVASKETSKREVENWFFMHFRIRVEGYQSMVNAIRQSAKDESLFTDYHLDKWTVKLRFKIRRSSPLKEALRACSARLGLVDDPDVIYCLDGFYGDSITGRIGNKNEVPNRIVQPSNTCRASGLTNGSSLFVSRATRADRQNAAAQLWSDIHRNEADDEDEDDGKSSGGSTSGGSPASPSGTPRAR